MLPATWPTVLSFSFISFCQPALWWHSCKVKFLSILLFFSVLFSLSFFIYLVYQHRDLHFCLVVSSTTVPFFPPFCQPVLWCHTCKVGFCSILYLIFFLLFSNCQLFLLKRYHDLLVHVSKFHFHPFAAVNMLQMFLLFFLLFLVFLCCFPPPPPPPPCQYSTSCHSHRSSHPATSNDVLLHFYDSILLWE